jgi:hypothetical protein
LARLNGTAIDEIVEEQETAKLTETAKLQDVQDHKPTSSVQRASVSNSELQQFRREQEAGNQPSIMKCVTSLIKSGEFSRYG